MDDKCVTGCGCGVPKVGTRFEEFRESLKRRSPIRAWLCKHIGYHTYVLSAAQDLEITWRIETECIFCGQLCTGYTWRPGIKW